mmetsp:Transcript_4432/g.12411  ORF Transcript_4432/g.12411 Transcript_4432/m.12411 type:complete len:254 (-) Transcript_4432:605-1366(-)
MCWGGGGIVCVLPRVGEPSMTGSVIVAGEVNDLGLRPAWGWRRGPGDRGRGGGAGGSGVARQHRVDELWIGLRGEDPQSQGDPFVQAMLEHGREAGGTWGFAVLAGLLIVKVLAVALAGRPCTLGADNGEGVQAPAQLFGPELLEEELPVVALVHFLHKEVERGEVGVRQRQVDAAAALAFPQQVLHVSPPRLCGEAESIGCKGEGMEAAWRRTCHMAALPDGVGEEESHRREVELPHLVSGPVRLLLLVHLR